jgi:hypothetical protein
MLTFQVRLERALFPTSNPFLARVMLNMIASPSFGGTDTCDNNLLHRLRILVLLPLWTSAIHIYLLPSTLRA